MQQVRYIIIASYCSIHSSFLKTQIMTLQHFTYIATITTYSPAPLQTLLQRCHLSGKRKNHRRPNKSLLVEIGKTERLLFSSSSTSHIQFRTINQYTKYSRLSRKKGENSVSGCVAVGC